MRRVVAGVDAAGRSCVVGDDELDPDHVTEGFQRHIVYETREAPPQSRPTGRGEDFPMEIDPGLIRWYFVEWGPASETEVPYHHTDTVDLGFVISGSIELLLDDGAHELGAGDCVVLGGIDHSWRIGPNGCRMCATSIGTRPPL